MLGQKPIHIDSALEDAFRLLPAQKSAFKKLGLVSVRDLLYYFPQRYQLMADRVPIAMLSKGADVVVYGHLSQISLGKTFKTRTAVAEATLTDESGAVKIIWFNQPYLAKMLPEGSIVRVAGKVATHGGGLSIANPAVEIVPVMPPRADDSLFAGSTEQIEKPIPVYSESRGITSRWIYHSIQKILSLNIHDEIVDPLPDALREKYHLPSLKTALVWIHSPNKEKDAQSARKRFAFEEVFLIQIALAKERATLSKLPAYTIDPPKKDLDGFVARFPFEATDSQKNAISAIISDFKRGNPMSRLLEGDVGSGKTAVAATTAYAIVSSRPPRREAGNLQVAYMAPTEILATQHFESFITYFRHMPIRIGLITGSGCRVFPSKTNPNSWTDISRTQLLKWVANGEIAILIGTHALISKSVKFEDLAYIIIDEQHRFGVKQRQTLARGKEKENSVSMFTPHLLSMTATPIPRTLALTMYGDLDLTLLQEMPRGRKPIITNIVPSAKRDGAYAEVREQLRLGRQAYIICPRIEEPDPDKEMALLAKSVKSEAERLKKNVFQEYEIDILHSKMKPAEKDAIMQEFTEHKIDILVATSVVEVGVNVPNATVIVIEGAERFGLAQLHQLRGRVVRSNHQAYCFIFSESSGKQTVERLKSFITAKNGFELAELDLKLRGAGVLSGTKQWGASDLAMEAFRNLPMVEAARSAAKIAIENDPELRKYPALREAVINRRKKLHLE